MKRLVALMMCAVSLGAAAQLPDFVPTNGLVAWYPFNGNADDESLNGHDAVVEGAILADDRFGNPSSAYLFDGDDRIFPSNPETFPLAERTTSIWMKSNAGAQNGRELFGYGGGGYGQEYCGTSWILTYNNQGNSSAQDAFELQGHCNVSSTIAPLAANELLNWHNIVVRTSALGTDMFIDGVLISHNTNFIHNTIPNCAVLGSVPAPDGACVYQSDANERWDGILDDFGVWHRALSTEEIMGLYLAEEPIVGCINPEACNFNPGANLDDGSCVFAPTIELGEAIETCEESVTLDAGPGFGSYLWSTGDTSQTIEVNVNGNYSVELGDDVLTDNSALSFDGINDFVDVGDNNPIMNNSSEATISAWINSYDNATWRAIATRWNNYGSQNWWFGLADNGRLHFGDGSNSVSYSNTDAYDNDGNWYYVTVTKNEHSINYYSNGVHVGSATSNVNVLTDSSEKLLIGAKNNASGSIPPDFFHGLISTVEVWDRTLSQEEIVEYHNCSPTGYEAGLVGYWKFNEGSGSTAIDNSGNVNDGAINGATYSDDVTHSDCANCSSTDTISVIFLSEGCTDDYACNYDTIAQCDDGSCDYSCCPGPGCCDQGLTWNWELSLCQDLNPADINLDGCVQLNDLLDLLSAYGDCGGEESPWQCGDPLEYQGYDYETVQIGEQCWFAENLRADNYRNGDAIPSDLDDTSWSLTDDGASIYGSDIGQCDDAYAGFDACTDAETSLAVYGRLYNFGAAINSRGLCPNSWHVSTDTDWFELELLFGLDEDLLQQTGYRGDIAPQLRAVSDLWWDYLDSESNNSSGLSFMPGGSRNYIGDYINAGDAGYCWAPNVSEEAYYRYMNFGNNGVDRDLNDPHAGMSVRCIKDAE